MSPNLWTTSVLIISISMHLSDLCVGVCAFDEIKEFSICVDADLSYIRCEC